MQKILENKLFLISVFIIMLINLTYAADIPCWEQVICEYSGTINSGSIISVSYDDEKAKIEEYCILDHLSTKDSSNRLIEIVIHQGQFQGGNSETKRIIVDGDFASNIPVVFKMSKDTSPTTIICNDIIPATESEAGYKIIRSLNYWSASYDQQWYTNNAGMPKWIAYFNHYLTLDGTPINILTTNNNPETEKQREDNRSATMIGALIIAIIGAVFIYNKNKIIGSFILLIIAIGTLILLPTILWLGFIFIAIAIILIIDAIANNR